MLRIASHIASYVGAAWKGRATRAGTVMACGLTLLQACNGGDATTPTSPTGAFAAGLGIATATVGTALATPIRLTVTGTDGRPVHGVRVTWSAADGGSVSALGALTDANGVTSTRWTLGPAAGLQTLTATVPGLSPVVFSAMGTADRAASIRFTNSTPRATILGDTIRLESSVVDRYGNAVALTPAFMVESGNDAVTLSATALTARAKGVAVLKATDRRAHV